MVGDKMNLLNVLVIGGIGYFLGKGAGESRVRLTQAITLNATLAGLEGSSSKTLTLTDEVPQLVELGTYKILMSATRVRRVSSNSAQDPGSDIFVTANVTDNLGNVSEFASLVDPQEGLSVELGSDLLILDIPKVVTTAP